MQHKYVFIPLENLWKYKNLFFIYSFLYIFIISTERTETKWHVKKIGRFMVFLDLGRFMDWIPVFLGGLYFKVEAH